MRMAAIGIILLQVMPLMAGQLTDDSKVVRESMFYATAGILDSQVAEKAVQESRSSQLSRTGPASFTCGLSNYTDVAACLEARSPKRIEIIKVTILTVQTTGLEENYKMILEVAGLPDIIVGKAATLRIGKKQEILLVAADSKLWEATVLRKELVRE